MDEYKVLKTFDYEDGSEYIVTDEVGDLHLFNVTNELVDGKIKIQIQLDNQQLWNVEKTLKQGDEFTVFATKWFNYQSVMAWIKKDCQVVKIIFAQNVDELPKQYQ